MQTSIKQFTIKDDSIECIEIKLSSGKNIRVIVENDKSIRVIADHRLENKNQPKTEKDWMFEKVAPQRIGLEHFYMD